MTLLRVIFFCLDYIHIRYLWNMSNFSNEYTLIGFTFEVFLLESI